MSLNNYKSGLAATLILAASASGARLRFGPPGFDEARFSSADPADRLIIRMQYL
jgi:hypothetical protein